ncbi:MAG: phosphoribosylformylglycinamidine cyclo-ligase [Dehalococcoidia bacterium]
MILANRRAKQTYRSAGVDITVANRIVEAVGKEARATFRPEVLSDLGFFGALFELKGYLEPVLVSSVDGVGTKLKVACALSRHETIGIDLVHHCVNDILACGAEPLFFQDYIAMARLVPSIVESVVQGMAAACREVGCALIGGETAEMPDLYPQGEYDLVGFIVGAVERNRIIDGKGIESGDAIIGLPSSGLHTNGYSLVRRVFNIEPSTLNTFYPELGRSLGEELLEPHRCYYPLLKPLFALIKGVAHITGGGLVGNLPRILPQGLAAKIEKGSWEIHPIFSMIQKQGNIDEREMYRVFNMGIGMALVCSQNDSQELMKAIAEARLIGQVVGRKGRERITIV